MEQISRINLEKLDQYELDAKDFCLSNGLICLSKNNDSVKQNHDSSYPLPVTLYPTQIPTKEFNYAFAIQKDFNKLIFSISNDYSFLKEALKNVILVDEFTRNLWNIYEKVYNEGIVQPISFAIIRNDYMIDMNKENRDIKLSQIEINTISCSFGAATSNVTLLHRYLLNKMNNKNMLDQHPNNDNINKLANTIVEAWKLYNNANAKVIFLVTNNERNIGDQRLLEYKCSDLNNEITVLRYSLSDIFKLGRLDSVKNRLFVGDNEIAVVYFRAGYDPKDYESQDDWNARLMIERSFAIKCPNISTHLVGAKIVQQVLSEPNVIEKFTADKTVADSIRATFVDLHAITEDNLEDIIQLIYAKAEYYVLKPQREGGGNNIYKEDIKKFVETLSDKKELMGYILMKLVKPYTAENYVIKAGNNIRKEILISEMGVFGVYIANGTNLLTNETGGYLLRSKPCDCNEGGVATGYSALDSICLV